MRSYSRQAVSKEHFIWDLLGAVRLAQNFIITPNERLFLKSILGVGKVLKYTKITGDSVNVRTYRKRNRTVVVSHKRHINERYDLDVKGLILEMGQEQLVEYLNKFLTKYCTPNTG